MPVISGKSSSPSRVVFCVVHLAYIIDSVRRGVFQPVLFAKNFLEQVSYFPFPLPFPLIFWRHRGLFPCVWVNSSSGLIGCSAQKHTPKFHDTTTGFSAKWRLRNEHRNSTLMTCRKPISYAAITNQKQSDLGSDTSSEYGISVLVSQTPFRRETCGGVTKYRLFSQAVQF